MEKVIPPGLNYADIKPEAIENQIRIIKYTPIATIQNAAPNDVIRFHLQGNGFFDPYSAYLRVEVDFGEIRTAQYGAATDLDFAGKFLDRSAHSLFSRLVIRSQGTELERIEEYDVMAAMINDMIYSSEQKQLHHFEGFGSRPIGATVLPAALNRYAEDFMPEASPLFSPLLNSGSSIQAQSSIDQGHWRYRAQRATNAANMANGDIITLLDTEFLARAMTSNAVDYVGTLNGTPVSTEQHGGPIFGAAANSSAYPGAANVALVVDGVQDGSFSYVLNGSTYRTNSQKAVFCIPLYSGILGVLMPEKKFIPLSLLPLELELTVNPYGVYAAGRNNDRRFTISKCEIFCHTLFFEQELHRSLEAVVAETGIFIHYNSFYLAPINTYGQNLQDIAGYAQIGVYLKSINSLHWTYLYNKYQNEPRCRKLSFQSHCLRSMQLRNGMDLIPSEPIQGQIGFSLSTNYPQNSHGQFLIETYKAWNKMHDPQTDGAINSFNYNIDSEPVTLVNLRNVFQQAVSIGRCQYGLTLEGEELGNQKQIVTGKRSVMPFDLNFQGRKKANMLSFMLMFLRADFIIYVRPDLVVTRLGL